MNLTMKYTSMVYDDDCSRSRVPGMYRVGLWMRVIKWLISDKRLNWQCKKLSWGMYQSDHQKNKERKRMKEWKEEMNRKGTDDMMIWYVNSSWLLCDCRVFRVTVNVTRQYHYKLIWFDLFPELHAHMLVSVRGYWSFPTVFPHWSVGKCWAGYRETESRILGLDVKPYRSVLCLSNKQFDNNCICMLTKCAAC